MEMAYAKEVIDYNNRVIQGAVRPQLVQKFASAAESFNNLVSLNICYITNTTVVWSSHISISLFQKVNELWEIVRYMSNIAPQLKDNPLLTRTSPPTQNQLILQARKYLEER